MSGSLKAGITFGCFIIALCIVSLFQIFSPSFKTYTNSETRVEILKYERSHTSGITRVHLKKVGSEDDTFIAYVADDCKFLPVKTVFDATVQRQVIKLLWLINAYSNRLVKGDVCQK